MVEEVGVELVAHSLQHLAAPTASQVSKQTGTEGQAQRAGSTRSGGGPKPTFNSDRKGQQQHSDQGEQVWTQQEDKPGCASKTSDLVNSHTRMAALAGESLSSRPASCAGAASSLTTTRSCRRGPAPAGRGSRRA
jgi:hypothetical protein